MDDNQRGKIRNRERALQVNDFSGLRFGKITPTDIDGLIEYHNRAYILIETKYNGAELQYGQMLAFDRLCDSLNKEKPTVFIVASHDSRGDIDVASAIVTRMRWMDATSPHNGGKLKEMTVREFIERFIAYVDKTFPDRHTCDVCRKKYSGEPHVIPDTFKRVCMACCPVCNITQEYIDETCEKCGKDFSKMVCNSSHICPECVLK